MAPDPRLKNNTDYSISMLKHEWSSYAAKHEQSKHVDQHSGGLMERAYRLFKLDLNTELSDSMTLSIRQLDQDWNFLNMLVRSLGKWSEADELMQKSGRNSTLQKINALGHEIDKDIKDCDFGKKYFWRPHKLLSLLGDCRRKTDELLKEEIGAALEYLSNLTFRVCSPHESFWGTFICYVTENLQFIKDADDGCLDKQVYVLCDELKLIQGYLHDVGQRIVSSKFLANHAFVIHIASVVVRIANQSCSLWFNRNDAEIAKIKAIRLVDLQHEIDPTNPEFIKLLLEFQQALYSPRSKATAQSKENADCVGYCCSYLLPSCSKEDLMKELISLITLFSKNTLKGHSSREDVQSLFAEVEAMLAEAAFLHRVGNQETETDDVHTCSELLTKICLLKIELFLKEQLNTSTSWMLLRDDQFLEVEKFLKNLRRFTKGLLKEGKTKYGTQNSVLAQELNDRVESLFDSFQSKNITNSIVKHSLLHLLYKIVFYKAESFLSEFLESQNGLIASGKDQIESLAVELRDFKRIVTTQLLRNLPDEEIIFIQVEAVARKITLFSYSFLPSNDKFKEILDSLPQLLDMAKHIKAKLKEISSQFPVSIFPKTYKLGFIDFLRGKIRELLKHDPESIAPVKHHLEQVQLHLESLKPFLIKVSDSDHEKGELNDLCNHIRDIAYKLEFVVESMEVDGHLQHSLWLYDLLEEIRIVNQQASGIPERSCVGQSRNLSQIALHTTSAINDTMVVLGDEEEAIINQLIGGSSQRDVVSIVGMPGIGKTTLAKKVYNDQNIICHFPRRAWCTVSQVHSKRGLLLDILSDIHGLTDEIHQMTDDDLQSKLRRSLLRNRYLIVMDDVWNIAAWNELQISFPDDSNGSRILITSRLQDVPLKIKPNSNPQHIRLFSDDESWMLLENKIFKSVGCPKELLQVGKQIAQQCQGLPLAVVAIAGLLQKTERTQDWWERISKSLSSQIINDPENQCKEILELSYKYLPECLKACFLYLGVFLEEKDIPVSKLTQFWMAEGFIQETETKSLEDVAEDYLMELINRSLVTISKTRSNGKVKACRLHDLFRDLCHLKAKEENFLRIVTRYDEPYATFPVSDYDMVFHNQHILDPVTFESYRLGIRLRRNHFVDSRPSGTGTRSLIFSASSDSEPRCPYDISFICNNFKLLRVLDLECINMGVSFPVEIGFMVQLRYLAVSGYVNSIPPSLAKLWKLETLIVKGLRGTVILPKTIWSMASLRYLHVNEHVVFSLQDDDEQASCSSHLDNLVSFSTPSLSFGEDAINMLRRFPNLLKMKCIFLESRDSPKNCNWFPSLEFLTRLESLKIIYYGGALNSWEFLLPSSLKKLTLSKFRLPWNHISMIGGLKNLRVLKLLAGAFEGPKWEMNEDEFKELKFLKLDTLNIAEWVASYDHLPNLEQLVLRNCKDLEEIPQDFAYIPTLEMIEVQWCGQYVVESAKRIGDETKEIKVLITHS